MNRQEKIDEVYRQLEAVEEKYRQEIDFIQRNYRIARRQLDERLRAILEENETAPR